MPFLEIAALFLGALVFTRVTRFVLRRVVRRVAERSRLGLTTWWLASAQRVGGETADVSEQRRRQRVDAASRVLNHIVSVIVWIGVTIAVFNLLDIDAAFFLSSAGFLGAGIAIGGQHKVNDYLTGLSVLFEDRYGIGDELLVHTGPAQEPIHAVVDHVGLMTTRLRDERSTLHVPNAALAVVRNLSQEASPSTLRLRVPADIPGFEVVSERAAADTLRQLAGSEHLTDVVFVGDLSTERTPDGDIDVAVRTLRPLDERARSKLVERAEAALRADDDR